MPRKLVRFFTASIIFILMPSVVHPQNGTSKSSSEIYLDMQKLGVAGSVLYIAAHPDDENTGMLAYFAKELKLRTGYLSLTRGDGGQNLIGPEKGDLMGLIRTYELLEARKIDGAEQFFTRAIDFGYSKSVDETLEFWDKEEILLDVVKIIREFRPDIIITRFPTGGYKTHGHHLSSAILAVEAFEKAGDENYESELLADYAPWKTVRIFHNDWRPMYDSTMDRSNFLAIDLGVYNPLLGKWYTEISAESRSMHKSQGFGARSRRGSRQDFLRLLAGIPAKESAFDGINLSWSRKGLNPAIQPLIDRAVKNFDFSDPSKSVPALVSILSKTRKLPDSFWKRNKAAELENLIVECSGLYVEALTDDHTAVRGESVEVNIQIVNPSNTGFLLSGVRLPFGQYQKAGSLKLSGNNFAARKSYLHIPADAEYSNPFWLKKPSEGERFSIEDFNLVGMPRTKGLTASVEFEVQGEVISVETPIVRKWVDRVSGEMTRQLTIVPPVTANFELPVYLFPNGSDGNVTVKLTAFEQNVTGKISLSVVKGWQVSPIEIPFSISGKYGEKVVEFRVQPENGNTSSTCGIEIQSDGSVITNSFVEINYNHIPKLQYFPKAGAKFVSVRAENTAKAIGYIEGAGDEVPAALSQMGCEVEFLSEDQLLNGQLSKFDAIISGVRAFNTQKNISNYMDNILKYVKSGGVFVEQYNVSFGLQSELLGAYPFKIGRDRITDERAELKILDPEHELFNRPNKITASDFNNWVQERGLYFASTWNEHFTPLLSGNDSGEPETRGALLYSQYGKGVFIYTGLSFFRQLPAGVPGAYRLFMNLISAKGGNLDK